MNAEFLFDEEQNTYQCKGSWSVLNIGNLYKKLTKKNFPTSKTLNISGANLQDFDTAGALLLKKYMQSLIDQGNEVHLVDFNENQQEILKLLDSKADAMNYKIVPPKNEGILYKIGQESVHKLNQLDGFLILIGDLSTKIFIALGQWKRFQVPSIISVINSAGIKALPIIGLLAFLIGLVLAHQMGLQLETYGANTFIAYLSGLAIFREFGPLITAIIIAGRTSSSFTAQIGSMKINEEIDALLTMGLSPTELLVMPKVLGLIIIFPLLIFWADLFSILGAMLLSMYKLNIYPYDFLNNLRESVGLKQMLLGLYKAPIFALLIALVGCFQGFKVQSSADSVGKQTTKSVVQALFLIIIADAAFSILYSWMGV